MHKILLDNVLNCFQLTTLGIMVSFIDAFRLEICSQDAMTSK